MKVGTAPYGTLLPSFHRSRNTYPPHLTLPYLTYQPTYQPTYSQPANRPANLSHDHFSPLHSLPHYPFPPLVSRFRNQKSGTVGTYLRYLTLRWARSESKSRGIGACVRACEAEVARARRRLCWFVCLFVYPSSCGMAGGRARAGRRKEGREGGFHGYLHGDTVLCIHFLIFYSFLGLDWIGLGGRRNSCAW